MFAVMEQPVNDAPSPKTASDRAAIWVASGVVSKMTTLHARAISAMSPAAAPTMAASGSETAGTWLRTGHAQWPGTRKVSDSLDSERSRRADDSRARSVTAHNLSLANVHKTFRPKISPPLAVPGGAVVWRVDCLSIQSAEQLSRSDLDLTRP